MSYEVDYRARFTCDRCKKRVTLYGEEEPDMPNGWGEVAIAVWKDGRRDSTRGNENRFSQVCPKCLPDLGLFIYDANNEEVE